MKGMKQPQPQPRSNMMMTTVKAAALLRRATNHNAHMLTRHGNLLLGRKGRTGSKPH